MSTNNETRRHGLAMPKVNTTCLVTAIKIVSHCSVVSTKEVKLNGIQSPRYFPRKLQAQQDKGPNGRIDGGTGETAPRDIGRNAKKKQGPLLEG